MCLIIAEAAGAGSRKNNTAASSMMQSEMLAPLLGAYTKNLIEGLLLVTRGADTQGQGACLCLRIKALHILLAWAGCVSCPLAGLWARTPAECGQANASPVTSKKCSALVGSTRPAFHCQGDEFLPAPHPG